MTLGLTPQERLARARADLRMGAAVVLEAPGAVALALAAETATAARLADLRARGPVDLAMTARRAATLKARAYDGDLARVIAADGRRTSPGCARPPTRRPTSPGR